MVILWSRIDSVVEVPSSLSPLPGAEKNVAVTNEARIADKANHSLSPDEARELTEELNELMDDLQTSLGFFVHEKLNHQIVVEIKNRETNELVKQIPTEELLAIKEKMEEFRGLLLDQSV